MYAVIKSGGKQYRVNEGQILRVEKLPVAEGDAVTFDQVLVLAQESACHIGTPFINGASVTATVIKQGRGKKIKIIKFKRRKHHAKRMGHRQDYTAVQISAITAGHAHKNEPTQATQQTEGE